ncbi:DUF6479 family protein [Streptomyces sp. NPDC006733]|uniref:DUF6479 family protein n=1 Tax=Streptomyces sp. NPDC006733 TaxID=3155460 RepID=UPI0033E5BAB8
MSEISEGSSPDMSPQVREISDLAVPHDVLVGIAPAALGVVMVAALIAAVAYGRRLRRRQPPPPTGPQPRDGAWQTPDELDAPTPPDHGPGYPERGTVAEAGSARRGEHRDSAHEPDRSAPGDPAPPAHGTADAPEG